ncbi:MAG: hypothetical protein LAO23_23620 [Acidobacteriia bacterium]|nr:hypothetical protein [Terriglobia bacterium]
MSSHFVLDIFGFGRRSLFRLFVALSLALVAAGQTIEGMKSFGNRMEGTSIRQNALEDFTLVAINRNFEQFPRNANLNVRFFLPRLTDSYPNSDVFVEAVELQDSYHYFMQSQNYQWTQGDWNVFHPWLTSDVIDRLGLDPKNLGVRAWYLTKNERVYAPVDVYQNSGKVVEHSYRFYFITGPDLQSIEVLVTNSSGSAMNIPRPDIECNKQINANCILYAAGSTVYFKLDMSSLPDGEYHVRLVGHVPRTSATTALSVALYHHRD